MFIGRVKAVGKLSSLITLQVPPQFLHSVLLIYLNISYFFIPFIYLSLDYFFLSLSIFIPSHSSFHLFIMKSLMHYDSDVIYCEIVE
jgi:hypothetical protein